MKNRIMVITLVIITLCLALYGKDEQFKKRMQTSFDELKHDAISIYVQDAVDAKAIKKAKIEFNLNNKIYHTSEEGKALVKLENGIYDLNISKDGYIPLKTQIEVQAGTVFGNDNLFTLSKEMPLDYVRIVLEWGKKPSDLDLHLVTDDGKHISYRNKRISGDKKIKLDRDDRTSYGPETITIKGLDNKVTYKVYVHNYSKRNDKNSDTFKDSQARISVYVRNKLYGLHNVSNGEGVFWEVVSIKNNEIEEINIIKN